jgi:phage shock protein E
MSYEQRMQDLGLSAPEDIRKSLTNDDAVLLDVRTVDEIAASGKFEKEGHKWVHSACMPTSADLEISDEMIPNKYAPVIVYCRSGRRASRAKEILESKGFSNVLNGGGFDDMVSMGL